VNFVFYGIPAFLHLSKVLFYLNNPLLFLMSRSFIFLFAAGWLLHAFPSYAQKEILLHTDTIDRSCLADASQLLDEALGFMQKNYYRRSEVQWSELIAEAKARLNASLDCHEAYNTISWCFSRLHEQHSFLMPPEKAARYNNDTPLLEQPPALADLVGEIKGEWIQDSIAYLTLPWISTTDSLVCMHIADSLQGLIARLDSRNISRWIIDLRKNTGGNCWPMLAGIGPLLGNGVCGYFVSDDERIPIVYQDGAALQGRHILCKVSGEAYHPRCRQRSIVVLTGKRTVSAGEIIALAFKGKDQVCLYGQPTAGLTTANATYSLSDHSMLVLTVCQEADHNGKICSGSILPDKYITPSSDDLSLTDPARNAAVDWLRTQ
jgi:C-terminal processing protease CtpA/Prc